MLISMLVLAVLGVGPEVEPLPYNVAELKAMPRVELTVMEDGNKITYSGVPLSYLLKAHLTGSNRMADLRKLSDAAILIQAKDNYQAVFSAVEAAMDTDGTKYLIAFERDGRPLDDKQGPAKMIVPGDPIKVRWIRMIDKVSLVRVVAP